MRPDRPLPDLERGLASRACPEPPAGLRDRVLAAVSAERRPAGQRPPRRRWDLVWQAAAAAVLALNLGMSAANAVRFQRLAAVPSGEVAPAPRMAGPRVPGASDDEDPVQRFAARALAGLRPAPDVGALGRACFQR